MSEIHVLPDRQHLRALVFGELGSGRTPFALSFPDPILIDPLSRVYRHEGGPPVPSLRSDSVVDINKLIARLKSGMLAVRTVVVGDICAITDRIERESGLKGYDAYCAVRDQIQTIFADLYALPVNVIVTTRTKKEYARPGEIVGGRVIEIGENIVLGAIPDIHKTLTERFDAIFEVYETERRIPTLRVHASGIPGPGLKRNDTIANPDGREILRRIGLPQLTAVSEAPTPAMYDGYLRAGMEARSRGLSDQVLARLYHGSRKAVPGDNGEYLTAAQMGHLTALLAAWQPQSTTETATVAETPDPAAGDIQRAAA